MYLITLFVVVLLSACQETGPSYESVSDQQVEQVSDLFDIEESVYLVYVYDDSEESNQLYDTIIPWLETKPDNQVYFLHRDRIPDEADMLDALPFLAMDSPVLAIMANGVYTEESFSGIDDINDYITSIGDAPIGTDYIPELDYDDFSEQLMENYDSILTLSDDVYLLYFYSPYCSHCNVVKQDVLGLFYQLDEMPFYLYNLSEIGSGVPIEEFHGTPTIFVVYDGEVIDSHVGSRDIPIFVNDYLNGTISYDQYE